MAKIPENTIVQLEPEDVQLEEEGNIADRTRSKKKCEPLGCTFDKFGMICDESGKPVLGKISLIWYP
jgi:hypothetical protein